ncbi:ceramidase domain-containing protein [candidate division KSB1 bacterium]|nr:ceramidase domain-containing protein [candidate division KSB1 bacterium]
MQQLKSLAWPLVAFTVIVFTAAFLSSQEYSWGDWQPASCMPASCFCEDIRPGAVAQPANAWSSLGFALIGLLVLGQCRNDLSAHKRRERWNPMTRQSSYAATYGVALIVIGLGSAFYHASLTFVGQFFDVMGMYLLATFVLVYNLDRWRTMPKKSFVLMYLAANLILAYLLIEVPVLRRWIFGAILLVALAPEFLRRRQQRADIQTKYLRAALATMLTAFIIWVLDYAKILCDPASWLQGHALWHLLGAQAAGYLYLYYRSENQAHSRTSHGSG